VAQILAFVTNLGVPLTTPGTLPRLNVRRIDTGGLVLTGVSMTELGDGLYAFDFSATPTLEYAYLVDADPLAAGQVSATERYQWGGVSGIQDEAIEVTLPAIPAAVWAVDLTGMVSGFVTAGEQLNAVRQFSFNQLNASPGAPGMVELYLDDDATVRVTFPLRDYLGGAVIGVAGVPALRGKAA